MRNESSSHPRAGPAPAGKVGMVGRRGGGAWTPRLEREFIHMTDLTHLALELRMGDETYGVFIHPDASPNDVERAAIRLDWMATQGDDLSPRRTWHVRETYHLEPDDDENG